MAGKGGGAWKVAYADFVTAMMAFFLVMWIVAQNKPIKEAVAGYFSDPFGVNARPGKAKPPLPGLDGGPVPPGKGPNKNSKGHGLSDIPTQKSYKSDEQDARKAKKPSLLVLHDGNHKEVGTLVPFPETSADLDDRGRQKLDELLPELMGKPFKIELRGHAAARPLPPGSPYHNGWELSYARSWSAMRYLQDKGIEPNRFRLSQSGTYEPKSLDQTEGIPALNSRVEIYVLGEYADDQNGTREQRAGRIKQPAKPQPRTQAAANP